MYIPHHYKALHKDIINEVLMKYSFATMISVIDNEPFISHLPFLFDSEKNIFISHCAKANPHWRLFKQNNQVTLIFQGPHSYISPAWYKPDPDHVPTWNYLAVHIKGTAQIIEQESICWSHMQKLVQYYENFYQTGWELPSVPNETLKQDLQKGITVFEVSIKNIEAKFKLSQKQNIEDRASVINHLPKFVGEQGQLLADYMKRVETDNKS